MGKNPVRAAWIVLSLAFVTFCVLAVSIPLAVRTYLLNADQEREAKLRVTSGVVLLVNPGADEPIAVVESRSLEPGTLIQTDESSLATLSFPVTQDANSAELATVQIYPSAQVRLVEFSRPRYGLGGRSDRIALDVIQGRIRINTADLQPQGLQTEIKTPQASTTLGPGSFAVDVANDKTQVVTRSGQALVEAEDSAVLVEAGQRTTIASGQAPSELAPTPENLIANGDFSQPLGPPTWLVSYYPEDDPTAGAVETVTEDGRQAARFSRINQPPTHTEVAITQVVERSVHDYDSLVLQLDVQLRWQSLPGAGEQSSEFPLMFRLDYEDVYGNHQFWTHGFYYRDPSPQWVVTGGQKIAQSVWFPFESGNLFERLKQEGLPLPAKINYLKIYASGHNYDSLATEVRLIAR